MAPADDDIWASGQVAALFGVSPHTFTRWGKEGRLPAILTLGGQRRYFKALIAKLLEDLNSINNRK